MDSDDITTIAIVAGLGYLVFRKELAPAIAGVSNAIGSAGNAVSGIVDVTAKGVGAYAGLLSKPIDALTSPMPAYTPNGYPNTWAGLGQFAKNIGGSLVGKAPNTSTLAGPVYTPPPSFNAAQTISPSNANFSSASGSSVYVPPPNISQSVNKSSGSPSRITNSRGQILESRGSLGGYKVVGAKNIKLR